MSEHDPDGLLDPGQPTEASHIAWRAAMTGQFTPAERMQIRIALGIIPIIEGADHDV